MAGNSLAKKDFLKLFNDVNGALSAGATKGTKRAGKVTLNDLLKRNNIELKLPADMQKTLGPALDADLNAPPATRAKICSACAACAVCTFCGQVNYSSGAIGLGGLVGLY